MLLGVNCLRAIAWPNHQHHELVRSWFLNVVNREWRTCAVTELGFIRLSANPVFTPEAVRPPEAVDLLAELKGKGNHCYIDVFNVVFPKSLLVDDATKEVKLRYGCADTRIGLAHGNLRTIVDFIIPNLTETRD